MPEAALDEDDAVRAHLPGRQPAVGRGGMLPLAAAWVALRVSCPEVGRQEKLRTMCFHSPVGHERETRTQDSVVVTGGRAGGRAGGAGKWSHVVPDGVV